MEAKKFFNNVYLLTLNKGYQVTNLYFTHKLDFRSQDVDYELVIFYSPKEAGDTDNFTIKSFEHERKVKNVSMYDHLIHKLESYLG